MVSSQESGEKPRRNMFYGVVGDTAFGEVIASFLAGGIGGQAGVPALGDLLVDFEELVFDELLLLVIADLFRTRGGCGRVRPGA